MQPASAQILEPDIDAIAVLIEREHFRAQAHVDVRLALRRLAKRSFEVRLMKAVARVPAERAYVLRSRPIEDQSPIDIDEMHSGRNMGVRQDALCQPQGLEYAHHLVVEMDGARQRIDVGFAVEHDNREPAIGQQIGQRRTDRAVANDANIRLCLVENLPSIAIIITI